MMAAATRKRARGPDTARDRLRRLLLLIPLLGDGQRHRLSDLARALGTSEETMIADLRQMVEGYSRHEGYGPHVELFIEHGHVQLLSSHFLRPMRLTVAEVRALELGLAMLRLERTPDEHAVIDAARARLAKALAKVGRPRAGDGEHASETGEYDPGPIYADAPLPASSAEHLKRIRTAIRRNRKVSLAYRKAAAAAPSERVVSPYMVLRGAGRYFVVAHDARAKELREYRLDRVHGVTILQEPRDVVAQVSLDAVREKERAFLGEGLPTLRVRYSARVARWIEEREVVEKCEDGSVIATYPLGDVEWAVRHVLQYGPEAEIVEPEEVRVLVRARLEGMRGNVGTEWPRAGVK